MRRMVVVGRQMMLVVVGFVSLCVGAVLLWSARPDTISDAPMLLLLSVLALILLPACIVALMEIERRRRAQGASMTSGSPGLIWPDDGRADSARARQRLATSLITHDEMPSRVHQAHEPGARRQRTWRAATPVREEHARRQGRTSE